ncbi:MAG: phosphate acetyltransferase, partial [Achromobacter piechaudii]
MTLPTSTHYDTLIARAQTLEPAYCAIAHPCDEPSLSAALEARDLGLLHPILVGPEKKIRDTAAQFKLNLGDARIVDTPHSHAAAETAVALVRNGEATLLMKG